MYVFYSNPDVGLVHVEGQALTFIGAEIDEEASEKTRTTVFGFPGAASKRRQIPRFLDTPFIVDKLTPYLRKKCEDGDILAGNVATLRACGLSDPAKLVSKERIAKGQEALTKAAAAKAEGAKKREEAAKAEADAAKKAAEELELRAKVEAAEADAAAKAEGAKKAPPSLKKDDKQS